MTKPMSRTILASLILVLALGLCACGTDLTAPAVSEADLAKDDSMGLDTSQKPGRRGVAPGRGLKLLDRTGAPGTWAIVNRADAPVMTFSSLTDVLDAFYSSPRRGSSVAWIQDFRSRPDFESFLLEMDNYYAQIWGDPHVELLMDKASSDLALLTREERRRYFGVYRPMQQVDDALDTVAANLAGNNKVWGVLKAFFEALAGEDNRFGDHDEDGIFNVNDDDYEGTVWSAGPVTVEADGEGGSDIRVGGCFDPCPIPIACGD